MPAEPEKGSVAFKDVEVSFGRVIALDGIACAIGPGESVAVVGPSGSGKTTFLRSISSAVRPSRGEVAVTGRLGIVYQDGKLLPWLNVVQNIDLARQGRDDVGGGRDTAVWLEAAGLNDKLRSFPYELSGGQRQRAAVIRSLSRNPDILLMDEPFSALDFVAKRRLGNLVQLVASRRRLTTIIVTHDLDDAVRLANRVIVLRQGRLVRDVTMTKKDPSTIKAIQHEIESLFEESAEP
jgi:sulfonate transport system ATP-binding protein